MFTLWKRQWKSHDWKSEEEDVLGCCRRPASYQNLPMHVKYRTEYSAIMLVRPPPPPPPPPPPTKPTTPTPPKTTQKHNNKRPTTTNKQTKQPLLIYNLVTVLIYNPVTVFWQANFAIRTEIRAKFNKNKHLDLPALHWCTKRRPTYTMKRHSPRSTTATDHRQLRVRSNTSKYIVVMYPR